MGDAQISVAGFMNGVLLSIMASLIGGGSKLCIRKSYLMERKCSQQALLSDARNRNCSCSGTGSIETHSLSIETEDVDDEIVENNHLVQFRSLFLRGSGMIGMTILNPVCCVLAMRYASPSILAPFSGMTLVWIIAFSECTIGEKPRNLQIIASALIVFGQILIAVFGDHTNVESLTLEEVVSICSLHLDFCSAIPCIKVCLIPSLNLKLWQSLDSFFCNLTYLLMALVLTCITWRILMAIPVQRRQYSDLSFRLLFITMIFWFLFLAHMINYGSINWKRFAWGVAGGSVTGFQNFVKDALALMQNYDGIQSFPAELFLLWFCGALFPLLGLLLLMQCMKRYDATYSSSMFVGSFICSTSLMSAFHYDTFQHLPTVWNWIFYPVGIIVLVSGTVMLSMEMYLKGRVIQMNEIV